MLKRFTAPIVAFLLVITGLTFVGSNYDMLAKPSEADQTYFLKSVPEANMVVVEPNYGKFYHPDPSIQGDSSGEYLYLRSCSFLSRSHAATGTRAIFTDIPNLAKIG